MKPKKLQPLPVAELRTRKEDLLPPSKHSLDHSRAQFDPRPTKYRKVDTETLRCQLLQLNTPCAMTQLLIPSIGKICHDHTYSKSVENASPTETEIYHVSTDRSNNLDDAFLDSRQVSEEKQCSIKSSLSVSKDIRLEIELKTLSQNTSVEWFHVRSRITSSVCGQIFIQKKKSVSLLCRVLYPKPLDPLPDAISGIQNEPIACAKYYCKYMNANGHPTLVTKPCGFIIDPIKSWLGASLDAFVHDPSSLCSNGIAEFKCPYSKRNDTIVHSCQDKGFCCEYIDGHIRLKRQHMYYHQVQLQLYVERDMYSWCDVCIYTLKDISVECIYLSDEWQHH